MAFGNIRIVHRKADGKRFLVIHGRALGLTPPPRGWR